MAGINNKEISEEDEILADREDVVSTDSKDITDITDDRKLKIIFPYGLSPSEFLKSSCRFFGCELNDFEQLHHFIKEYFKVTFEILYSGKYTPNEKDLEDNYYIAFLSIKDPFLGLRVKQYAKIGIPIIFIKYSPEMECDIINTTNNKGECYQNRLRCGGKLPEHCDGKFFKELTFRDKTTDATIPIIEDVFDIKNIPIFSMSFLIDFIIWYGNYGIKLRDFRDSIKEKDMENFYAIMKSSGMDLAIQKQRGPIRT